jgi:hypothetical protein
MALADKYPRLKTLAPLILVAGAALSYMVSSRHMAKDHKVTYRFIHDPTDVTELSASWSAANEKDQDSVAGARFNFAAGKAPKELEANVKLRDGEYFVDLTVLGTGEPRSVRRRVLLDERITSIAVP